MFRLVFVAFALSSVAGTASAVKWIKLTAGEPLPPDAIPIPNTSSHVGRARHFDDILPAEVHPNSTATITVCGKTIRKHAFEVLTSAKPCSWQSLQRGEDLPEDLLLVGREDKNRPIFVGSRRNLYHSNYEYLQTFSLTSSDLENLMNNDKRVLVCPSERVWADVPAKDVPENAVSGGKSRDGHDMFVARLKNGCRILPGQVVPAEKVATTWVGEEVIEGRYCQVLLGADDQYSWLAITDDKFPDNAVVGSTDSSDVYYIAKEVPSNIILYVTNLFLDEIGRYEILVENVKEIQHEPHSHVEFKLPNEDYSYIEMNSYH